MTVEELIAGVRGGNRRALAKAISLMENTHPSRREAAAQVLKGLMSHTGKSLRIGISGVPGVGKSTFIEALGQVIVNEGHRLAVLTVDPSSVVSGGSILGDQVRMARLTSDERVFIRQSPSGSHLGGVARRTRENMLLCEAAHYDVILVETVGVGQSEFVVSEMVDFFLLLLLPNAGDEMQGIKRGIMELVDGVVIHKSDGEQRAMAHQARRFLTNALHYMNRQAEVLLASSLTQEGIVEVWRHVVSVLHQRLDQGTLQSRRLRQNESWYRATIQESVLDAVFQQPRWREIHERQLEKMKQGWWMPTLLAEEFLQQFWQGTSGLEGASCGGEERNDPAST
jgi:LAO/AO transport system kinase